MENVVKRSSEGSQDNHLSFHSENSLEAAKAELATAEHELEQAQRDLAKAQHDLQKAAEKEKHHHQFEVTVIYNGLSKEFEVRRDELTQQLLEQARQAFGPINNPHLLGLFTKDGVELQDNQTLRSAGVKPHDVLLLRPSTVRGG